MAVVEWTTNYPSSQDTGAGGVDQCPDLVNTQDDTRVSQIHTMRNKVQSLALKVGDNSNLPAGCLGQRVTAIENLSPPRFLLGKDLNPFSKQFTYPLEGPEDVLVFFTVKDSNAAFSTVRFIFSSYIDANTYNVRMVFGTAEHTLSGLSNTSEAVTKYDLNVGAVASNTRVEAKIEVDLPGPSGTVSFYAVEIWAVMPW